MCISVRINFKKNLSLRLIKITNLMQCIKIKIVIDFFYLKIILQLD